MRIRLMGYLFVAIAVAGCASSHVRPALTTITLAGTPITVDVPRGFVAADEDEVVSYPPRPEQYFYRPKLPNGATPGDPEIYIEQLTGDDASVSLDAYIDTIAKPSQYPSLPFPPKTMIVGGVRAIEIAKGVEMIADFEGGGAGYANMTTYEIAFQYQGKNYHCVMEAGGDSDKQYVPVFEQFCQSVRFASK